MANRTAQQIWKAIQHATRAIARANPSMTFDEARTIATAAVEEDRMSREMPTTDRELRIENQRLKRQVHRMTRVPQVA